MTDTDDRPEVEQPPDFEALWRYSMQAVRILGREVRALRAEVEALRARLDREAS